MDDVVLVAAVPEFIPLSPPFVGTEAWILTVCPFCPIFPLPIPFPFSFLFPFVRFPRTGGVV